MLLPSQQIAAVIEKACATTGITEGQIMSRLKDTDICRVRFAIWYALSKKGMTCREIGKAFRRNNTVVSSGIRSAKKQIDFQKLCTSLLKSPTA